MNHISSDSAGFKTRSRTTKFVAKPRPRRGGMRQQRGTWKVSNPPAASHHASYLQRAHVVSLLSCFFNVRTVRALICIRSECCPMPSCAVPCRLCYQMCTRAYPCTCTCRCTLRCAGADWRPAGQGGGGWRHSRQGLQRTINERHWSNDRHWRRRIAGAINNASRKFCLRRRAAGFYKPPAAGIRLA